MKEYGYSKDYVLTELPLLDGMIMYSFAMCNDPVHKFSGLHMENGGYAGREADMLLEELKEFRKKQSVHK